MPRPLENDYAPFAHAYVSKVKSNDVKTMIEQEAGPVETFYMNLPEEKANYRYAEGKWTLKDLLQHVIDTERVLCHRILRIARKDQAPNLPFDEDSYAANAGADKRSFPSLKEEFQALRKSTNLMLQSMTEEQLSATGISSNHHATANAIAFIIIGHLKHHQVIIEERYL